MAKQPMRDLVVLLPGIMGSVLQQNGKDVWGISASSLVNFLFSGGDDIKSLQLTNDPVDQDDVGDGITAARLFDDVHLIPGLWKIDGYGRIVQTIKSQFDVTDGENFIAFPYDWRRDNRVAARKLARVTGEKLRTWRNKSGNANAKLILVGHSMGGLVARYFLECLEGWRDTRVLFTFGTPYRGSLNALDFLANGYRKGPLDLTNFVRSLTSVYQLLPIYPCCDFGGGTMQRVDAGRIPNVDAAKVSSALAFHREIADAVKQHSESIDYIEGKYHIVPVVGTQQPTLQSARVVVEGVTVLADYLGEDRQGDGTVPRVSAVPLELSTAGVEVFEADRHSSLQNADHPLLQLTEVLRNLDLDLNLFREFHYAPPPEPAKQITLGLAVDDAYEEGDSIIARAWTQGEHALLQATFVDTEKNAPVATLPMSRTTAGSYQCESGPLPTGTYRVTVSGSENVKPVNDVFAVFAAEPALRGTREVAFRWKPNLIVFDATKPAHQLQQRLENEVSPDFVVLSRPDGNVYAYTPDEILSRLAPGNSPVQTVLDLGETNRSAVEGGQGHGFEGPARNRVVRVSDRGRPISVRSLPMAEPPAYSANDEPILKAEETRGAEFVTRGLSDEYITEEAGKSLVAAAAEQEVERYPSLDVQGDIRPASRLQITVDLELKPGQTTSASPLGLPIPAGQDHIDVTTVVTSPYLNFEKGANEGQIRVYRDKASDSFRTSCTVAPELPSSEFSLRASFFYDGRFCGSYERILQEVRAMAIAVGSPTVVPLTTSVAVPISRPVYIETSAPSPKLTVQIHHALGTTDGTLEFALNFPDEVRQDCPGLPDSSQGRTSIGSKPEEFVQQLLKQCERLKPGQHMQFFTGVGQLLWNKTAPEFQQTYQAMRNHYGAGFPIQFITDEAYMPWELMLVPPDQQGHQFLAQIHPVGRWLLEYDNRRRCKLPSGRIVTIAPHYDPPVRDLPAAQLESQKIQNDFKNLAVAVNGEKDKVLALLKDSLSLPISIMHFAGHGDAQLNSAEFACILLEHNTELSVLEVRAPNIALGKKYHTLAFFNACRIGATNETLGMIGGWAEALINDDFGGFIAPLWAVSDNQAAVVSTKFISLLVQDGLTVGEALRQIRAEYGDRSPTYLSYLYYGDVMARFSQN